MAFEAEGMNRRRIITKVRELFLDSPERWRSGACRGTGGTQMKVLAVVACCCTFMVGCSQQPASKAAEAQSAPKSASEASVVEMPAYLDVQANPDKYVGRKVSWIGTEAMTGYC
jgi:hypothetical protein